MDDRLAKIEEGLERLMPRGLSDSGKAALEAQIDELAEGVEEVRGGGWRLGAVAAAVAAMVAGVAFWPQGTDEGVPVLAVVGESLDGVATLSAALRVNAHFDGGVVHGDGSGIPVRYHGYDLTERQEMVDEETGYPIEVVERREEWIGVKMTSL